MVYKNIGQSEGGKVKAESTVIMSQKKLRLFGVLFCFILSMGMLGISFSVFRVGEEVKRITSSWAPNISDIGKLKFVDSTSLETEQEVMANITDMSMPFDYSYVEEVSASTFLVDGLGAIIVKSCLQGTVSEIGSEGGKKTVTLSHGKGLTSVYKNLDSLGVKVGDKVEKNTPLGVVNNSQIYLQVLYKNKVIAGLKVQDGEMTFI